MVNVSKQVLSKNNLQKINDLFLTHITRIGDSNRSRKLINELLTPAEKLQLAKRLSIVVMLEWGYTPTQIQHVLKVSRTTIGSVEDKIAKGSYAETIEEIKRSRKGDLWVALEKILRAGMPSQGKGRWRYTQHLSVRQYKVKK